jgi:AcrR family transcriptional regulator
MAAISRPSSLRKHQAILAAAEEVFLRDGYLGANMEEVAAQSGVSKQTVYAHFGSKEALFVELVTSMTTVAGDGVHDEVADPSHRDDLPAFLAEYAYRQLSVVLTPRILSLRRLVIGEAARFPELGAALWASGPERAMRSMAARFARLDAAGWLRAEHPETAASFFNWLVMSEPLNAAMILGDAAVPGERELREHCVEAVRVFLAAYGPGSADRSVAGAAAGPA